MLLEDIATNEDFAIGVDLDGVLADFDGRLSLINGGIPTSQIPRGRVWRSIEQSNEKEPFFLHLEKMPDADLLWNFVKGNFVNRFILSACGYTPKDAADQKRQWIARELGRDVVAKIVTSSPDKAQFASPTTILVDDRMKSIEPWVAAGGIGVLHKNSQDTIRQLQAIIQKRRDTVGVP